MKTNDIQLNKYYKLTIWDDDDAIFVKCIGKDNGHWELESPDMELPLYLYDSEEERESIEEIDEAYYFIHMAGQAIENAIVKDVIDLRNKRLDETDIN